MTDITIPPEALRAARAASMNARGDGDCPIEAACLAVLKTWPKAVFAIEANNAPCIILPLPKENTNAE